MPRRLRHGVDKLPAGDRQNELREALLSEFESNGGPEDLILEQFSRLKKVPESVDVWSMAVMMGGEYPVKILDAISRLPDGAERNTWLAETAAVWVQRDAPAAASWVDNLPSTEVRAAVLNRILDRWWPEDPPAAQAWATRQPEGTLRDAAFQSVATFLTEESPEQAVNWAAAITDAGLREKHVEAALRAWANIDPAGALDAIGGLPLEDLEKELQIQKLQSGTP